MLLLMKSYDSPMPFTEISERYHPLMDAPVKLSDGTIVSAMSLADRAYQHEWFGAQLRTQVPRFAFLFESNDRIVEYLGKDADPIGHMYELAFHAARVIEHENEPIDEKDRGVLMLALLVHDMDETMHPQIENACGGVTGDIRAGGKTPSDKELQSKIRDTFYRTVLYDVPQNTHRRVEAIISHEDKTHLGELYEACHDFQAFETTQHAKTTLTKGIYSNSDKPGIEYVAIDVNMTTRDRLNPHFSRFALIDNLVKESPAT